MYTPLNNAYAYISTAHVVGDNQLVVDDASRFGSPSTDAPIRVCATVGSTDVIFKVVGVSGNTLTLDGTTPTIEGTSDINLSIGTIVDVRITAGAISDLNTIVVNLQSGGASSVESANGFDGTVTNGVLAIETTINGIPKGNGTAFSVAEPSVDYVVPTDLDGYVSQSGEYSNPSWITSLAASKVTGITSSLGYNYQGTNPYDDSSLIAAYDATYLNLSDKSLVASWPDATGKSDPLTQSNDSCKPTFYADIPSLYFDGVDDLLTNTTTSIPLSNCTVLWVASLVNTANVSGGWYIGIGNAAMASSRCLGGGSGFPVYWTGSSVLSATNGGWMSGFVSPGPQVITFVSDGTNVRLGSGGVESTLSQAESATMTGIGVGGFAAALSNLYGNFYLHACLVFNTALSSDTLQSYVSWLNSKFGISRSSPLSRPSILFVGNSIVAGSGETNYTYAWPELFMGLLGDNWWYLNLGIPGATNQLVEQQITLGKKAGQILAGPQKRKVVIAWEGSNDTNYTNITSLYTQWVAQSVDVFACTGISRGGSPYDVILTTNNPSLRGDWKGFGCVGLIDYAMDYRFATTSSNMGTVYAYDHVHPSGLGNEILASITYNNFLVYLYPRGGGPIPRFPGYTEDATPTTIKSWFPGADGTYMLKLNAEAFRVDNTEDVSIIDMVYKLKISSGTLTTTQISSGAKSYNVLSTATIGVIPSTSGPLSTDGVGGFDIQVTGEASKSIAWIVSAQLISFN